MKNNQKLVIKDLETEIHFRYLEGILKLILPNKVIQLNHEQTFCVSNTLTGPLFVTILNYDVIRIYHDIAREPVYKLVVIKPPYGGSKCLK